MKTPRPRVLPGTTVVSRCGCGNLYVTMNKKDNRLFEVVISLGKAGGCACATMEAMGRLISWGLRSGAEIESAIKTLDGISCPQANGGVKSCVSVIAEIMREQTEE